MSLYNYLRSCCNEKEQKKRVLRDVVCLHANGNGPVERENLMVERRGTNFWSHVLVWARRDRTQCVSRGLGLS